MKNALTQWYSWLAMLILAGALVLGFLQFSWLDELRVQEEKRLRELAESSSEIISNELLSIVRSIIEWHSFGKFLEKLTPEFVLNDLDRFKKETELSPFLKNIVYLRSDGDVKGLFIDPSIQKVTPLNDSTISSLRTQTKMRFEPTKNLYEITTNILQADSLVFLVERRDKSSSEVANVFYTFDAQHMLDSALVSASKSGSFDLNERFRVFLKNTKTNAYVANFDDAQILNNEADVERNIDFSSVKSASSIIFKYLTIREDDGPKMDVSIDSLVSSSNKSVRLFFDNMDQFPEVVPNDSLNIDLEDFPGGFSYSFEQSVSQVKGGSSNDVVVSSSSNSSSGSSNSYSVSHSSSSSSGASGKRQVSNEFSFEEDENALGVGLKHIKSIAIASDENVFGVRNKGAKDSIWVLQLYNIDGSISVAALGARNRNLGIALGIIALLAIGLVIALFNFQSMKNLADQQMQFVATVSHELRTPVAVMRSAGQNLASGIVKEESKIKEYGTMVASNAQRLGELVDNVLLFARLEKGSPDISVSNCSINTTIEEILINLASEIDKKEVKIRSFLPSGIDIKSDSSAISVIFRNLIHNAVKYSHNGGQVNLYAEDKGDNWVVSIRDEGIGIPKQDLRQIFSPFFRASNARKAQIKGSGLGLNLVSRYCNLLGINVHVESTADKGTRFELTIPKNFNVEEKNV